LSCPALLLHVFRYCKRFGLSCVAQFDEQDEASGGCGLGAQCASCSIEKTCGTGAANVDHICRCGPLGAVAQPPPATAAPAAGPATGNCPGGIKTREIRLGFLGPYNNPNPERGVESVPVLGAAFVAAVEWLNAGA